MEAEVLLPESISRDVFEKYHQLIEHIKMKINENLLFEEDNTQVLNDYDFLDKVISAIERCLQDIFSIKDFEFKDEIFLAVQENLQSWIYFLASINEVKNLVDPLSYRLLPLLNLLQTINNNNSIEKTRYIKKLKAEIEDLAFVIDIKKAWGVQKTNGYVEDDDDDDFAEERRQGQIFKYFSQNNFQKVKLSEFEIDLFDLTPVTKELFIYYLSDELLSKFSINFFNIPNLETLKNLDIEELRKKLSNINSDENFERLFEFDDNNEMAVWNVYFNLHSYKENAAEMGYLIWSFSKSIESIDDVEVELINWGNGSKWFQLKIKIKSLAAKVDLQQVLKNARRGVEEVYTKKTIDELQKFEAEKNKLQAEAEKVKKESKNMLDEQQAKFKKELSIHKDILEIQQKELDIEDKKADIRLKNLTYLKGLSELMKEGIIQNNSDIQIEINNVLYLKKTSTKLEKGQIEYIDIDEKIINKDENIDFGKQALNSSEQAI